jgi:hypothetical protein
MVTKPRQTAPFVTREKQDAFDPVLTSTSSDVPGLLTTRPTFEDFVYYATAQREIERTQDGIKYVVHKRSLEHFISAMGTDLAVDQEE